MFIFLAILNIETCVKEEFHRDCNVLLRHHGKSLHWRQLKETSKWPVYWMFVMVTVTSFKYSYNGFWLIGCCVHWTLAKHSVSFEAIVCWNKMQISFNLVLVVLIFQNRLNITQSFLCNEKRNSKNNSLTQMWYVAKKNKITKYYNLSNWLTFWWFFHFIDFQTKNCDLISTDNNLRKIIRVYFKKIHFFCLQFTVIVTEQWIIIKNERKIITIGIAHSELVSKPSYFYNGLDWFYGQSFGGKIATRLSWNQNMLLVNESKTWHWTWTTTRRLHKPHGIHTYKQYIIECISY